MSQRGVSRPAPPRPRPLRPSVIMAASADGVNKHGDGPPAAPQDITAGEEPAPTPTSTHNDPWQGYVSDKKPVSEKRKWKSKCSVRAVGRRDQAALDRREGLGAVRQVTNIVWILFRGTEQSELI